MDFPESQIIADCQKGEYSQFGQLYDAYIKKIYSFIYFRTHHKETAEDLTSVVFMKALEKISSFNGNKGQFSSWLYQIARNSIIDHYRTFKAEEDLENAWDVPSNSNVERDADISRQMENVKKQLAELPAQQRDVVVMRVWDGLSHKEIAEILRISESSSKMSFSRALAKINKETVTTLAALAVILGNQNF